MKQELLQLLPVWGPWLLAVSAFLSCMMLPMPTSFLLISAGALSGVGHDFLLEAALGAVIGATLGDLVAFGLGQRLGARLTKPPQRYAKLVTRAGDFMDRFGLLAVFLSRWLFTPLGPITNYLAGAARLTLPGFAIASLGGEVIWAGFHLLLGHLAGRQLRHSDAAELKAVAIAATLAALLLGARWLWRRRSGGAI